MVGTFVRQILLLIWLTGFVISLFKIADHWEYDVKPPDIHAMLANRVDAGALKQSVDNALREEAYDEARSLLAIGRQYNHPLDYPFYEQYLQKHDTAGARLGRQIAGFAEGFISGQSTEASGVIGALTADFTVVGDVRDLSEQYSRYQQGLPVNQLITSLAGVGVGLTAASVSSLGAVAPVKAGASMLKLAARTNRLSRPFRNELTMMAGRVFDWQQFLRMSKSADLSSITRIAKQAFNPKAARQITALAEQANAIRKNTSIADSVQLIQYVDSVTELNRLRRVTDKFGVHSRGVFRLLGKGAIRGVKVLKVTLALLISVTSALFFALSFIVTIGGEQKKKPVSRSF
ncbi:MAG: hypothetical protein CSB47_09630 [Proteobacteria bacterium]|nr:MAG: hypothetical protein CSB47_09630 [Pseudomonadota bacterium]